MAYCLNILEEELKNKVAQDYFGDFDCTRIIKKIDFCAAPKVDAKQKQLFEAPAVLWAEAKKGNKADLNESFVQLILTIGRERIADHQQPPNFLGAFDAEKSHTQKVTKKEALASFFKWLLRWDSNLQPFG